ncbi:MAG: CheB methylesterase domain-containing protein, partial [Methanosarcinales archaeon]
MIQNKNQKEIVVIAASTGGPAALTKIIPKIPKNLPATILIIQHMLPTFTSGFAQRLNKLSAIKVKEAKEGDYIKPGLALIAPGDYHMVIT